jgi:divinyl protochlorophyllide a 8-vinyl-reductase
VSSESTAARIGPNAILQVFAALRATYPEERTAAIAARAGLSKLLDAPPQRMIAESDVIALHGAVRRELGLVPAREVLAAAGRGTGDYLLAHRIPVLAQRILRVLPARLSSRALLAAIARHTWTFAGSGEVVFQPGHPVAVTIARCPACRGERAGIMLCDYYAKTFERLYGQLVHPRSVVRETACIARGDDSCRFEIRWDG